MELKLGANVICSDGRQAGKLRFVSFDRKSMALDSIIVERGFLGARDLVLTTNDISEIGPDGSRIDLKIDEAELDKRPEYTPANYVRQVPGSNKFTTDTGFGTLSTAPGFPGGAMSGEAVASIAGGVPSPIYPVGTDYTETGASVIQQDVEEELNVDENFPMIKEGARVTDRYDNSIGNVSSLSLDENLRVTALTLKEGFVFTKHEVIPIDWVENLDDTTVILKYTREELDQRRNEGGDFTTNDQTNNRGQQDLVSGNPANYNLDQRDYSNTTTTPSSQTLPNPATPYRDDLQSYDNAAARPAVANNTTFSGNDQNYMTEPAVENTPTMGTATGNYNSANESQPVTRQVTTNPDTNFVSESSTSNERREVMRDNYDNNAGRTNRDTDNTRGATPVGNEQYGDTRTERGERGDSNADMDNRSPLSPATNRIADQISGDSSDELSGTATRDQGDPTGMGSGVVGVPIAPSTVGVTGTTTPLAAPVASPMEDDDIERRNRDERS